MRHRRIALLFIAVAFALVPVVWLPRLVSHGHEIVVPIDRAALDSGAVQLRPGSGSVVSQDAMRPNDPRLIETTPYGRLPRIAENGDRSSEIYARPVALKRVPVALPHVAILVMNSGISETLTADASQSLPADVSFSISPYAQNAAEQVSDVRQRGHEVVLDIKSKAENLMTEDRGPYALDPVFDARKNRERLYWMMARFQNYVGLVNDITPAFAQSVLARELLRDEPRRRGLFSFSIVRSSGSAFELMPDPTREASSPHRIVLPGRHPSDLDHALQSVLQRLSGAEFRERGLALIIDPGPLALDVMKGWIDQHQSRQFDLVPLSALMRRGGQG